MRLDEEEYVIFGPFIERFSDNRYLLDYYESLLAELRLLTEEYKLRRDEHQE